MECAYLGNVLQRQSALGVRRVHEKCCGEGVKRRRRRRRRRRGEGLAFMKLTISSAHG